MSPSGMNKNINTWSQLQQDYGEKILKVLTLQNIILPSWVCLYTGLHLWLFVMIQHAPILQILKYPTIILAMKIPNSTYISLATWHNHMHFNLLFYCKCSPQTVHAVCAHFSQILFSVFFSVSESVSVILLLGCTCYFQTSRSEILFLSITSQHRCTPGIHRSPPTVRLSDQVYR